MPDTRGAVPRGPERTQAAPDSPEALEMCVIDVWADAAGMAQTYSNPEFGRGLSQLFVGEPSVSTWVHPAGDWVEW